MDKVIENNQSAILLAARLLLAVLFLMAGIGKILAYDGTASFMSSVGVPGLLLPLVITLEVGGAIALILGVKVRMVAVALAVFCVVSAIIFHSNFSLQSEQTAFLKNLSLAGGLLALAVSGAGRFSLAKS